MSGINTGWRGILLEWNTPSLAMKSMRQYGTLPAQLAALVGCPQDPTHHPEGDAFKHTGHVLDAMADIMSREGITGSRRLTFMLAALLHDVGKAVDTKWNEEKGKYTAYGHDVSGVPIARAFLESRENFSENICEVLPLVRHHMAHCRQGFTAKAVRKLARELQPMTLSDLVLVLEADCAGRPPIEPGLPPCITDELVPIAKSNGWWTDCHPADRR